MSELSVVYVLTNPAMPGLVKIGRTDQDDANTRIAQLYTTGVPVPFKLEFACKVPNSEEVERALHIAFGPSRVNPKREFFTLNADQAIAILRLLHTEDTATAYRGYYCCGCSATNWPRSAVAGGGGPTTVPTAKYQF